MSKHSQVWFRIKLVFCVIHVSGCDLLITVPSYIYMEKEMATHSNILAWRIPWTGEPGALQSTGVTKSWKWLSDSNTFTFLYICMCIYICVSVYIYIYIYIYTLKQALIWAIHFELVFKKWLHLKELNCISPETFYKSDFSILVR